MQKLEAGNIGTRHSLRSACSRGPLRPLRGSTCGLGQPDAFGAGTSPHGSRTPARGGYENTSTLATIGRLLAAVVLLVSGGCITRTGEYYQNSLGDSPLAILRMKENAAVAPRTI